MLLKKGRGDERKRFHTWLIKVVYEKGAKLVDDPSLDRVLMNPMKRGVMADINSL